MSKKIMFSEILRNSLVLTVDNIGLFLQLAAVAALGIALLALLPVLFFGFNGIQTAFAYSVGDIAVFIRPEFPPLKFVVVGSLYCVLAWSMFVAFWIGSMRIAFDLIDYGTSSIKHVWVGDRKLIAYLGASALFFVVFLVGFLLLVIPGIYAAICFMFFGQFIVDRNMSAVESLKASLELTKGYRWQLLCWIIVSLVVGKFFGFFASPVLLVANALLYRALIAAKQ